MLHRTEQTRTYPCANCGGQLEFGIAQQMLVCPHCGNRQEIVEDAGKAVEEQDLRRAVGAMQQATVVAGGIQQFAGEKEIVCQNCGGHTTFSGTLTATRCPYCATPIQRDDVHDAPERLAVDGVLPFRVDDRTAKDAIENWIDSRWFAPTEFKKYKETGSFTSVYMAYFTYDAECDTDYDGRRGDEYTVTVGSGENQRTETRVRWRHVSGQVHNSFDDIAVCANTGLERKHVTALEPWPTQGARPFSPEYVAGHLCRTYDHDVEQSFGEARQRIDGEVRETVKRDIGGDRQDINRLQTTFGAMTFKHLLLPIWLLTVIFEGQPFQVMINGVTGEVQGQRPWSKVKIAIAVVAAIILVIVIAVVWSSVGGGSSGSGSSR
jgi:DNA-directed RNA polymerase subunit RPC12/RpoP